MMALKAIPQQSSKNVSNSAKQHHLAKCVAAQGDPSQLAVSVQV